MQSLLYGREILPQEVPEEYRKLLENEKIEKRSGFIEEGPRLRCRRCNQEIDQTMEQFCCCKKACGYCTECIQMGKVKRCSVFYSLPEPNQFNIVEPILVWGGTLSEQQESASKDLIQTVKKKEIRLLWAVTGAGKTEMLFPAIEYALRQKERVCIASPRVDVCLELAPRLCAAFPHISQSVLHGEMEESYTYAQLVIATTHQLYRFKEAFDVLIIDEVDAFPFYMDEALEFAAEKARKKNSALVYLTATPDRKKQKAIKKKKLEATILPARYHGYPLPVPVAKWSGNWQEKLVRRPEGVNLVKQMQQLVKQKKRFLIFVPNVKWMQAFEQKLREVFPQADFESVHSSDPKRKEKVKRMREEKLDFLLSTTILERGVTFKHIDVLVIGAEDRIFTESALVQIAGRAGRSAAYPTGDVLFYHDGWSKEMKRAIRQIKQMNQRAQERGLLVEERNESRGSLK